MSRFVIELSNLTFLAPRTITFNAAGREWQLEDRSARLTADQRRETDRQTLLTGELTTAAQSEETFANVAPAAGIICRLLTLARSRDIKDVQYFHVDAANNIISQRASSMHLHSFDSGNSPVIDHFNGNGDVRNLLENGYPVFATESQWWHRTIDFFFQSRTQPYLDVRAVLLNILMDRLAAKLPGNRIGGEIVPGLEAHLAKNSQLEKDVTAIFQIYWPSWSVDHSRQQITSHLSNNNARPSFAKGIRRLCTTHQVEPPKSSLLGIRHKLIHEGELVTDDEMLSAYITELDSTIVLLLLRKLNYSGKQVFVRKAGRVPIDMPPIVSAVPVLQETVASPSVDFPSRLSRFWALARLACSKSGK